MSETVLVENEAEAPGTGLHLAAAFSGMLSELEILVWALNRGLWGPGLHGACQSPSFGKLPGWEAAAGRPGLRWQRENLCGELGETQGT